MFEAALASGVVAQGADALLMGVLPTSVVATSLAAGLADAGVMITASHNAAADNGFKVFGPGGHKLQDAQTRLIETELNAASQDPSTVTAAGVAGRLIDASRESFEVYREAFASAVPNVACLSGLRLAVDLANGAAAPLLPWLQRWLPAEVIATGVGDGDINDRCGCLHPERLQALVVEQGCIAGIAVDGDADRCVIVDEKGALLNGDGLGVWLARSRKAKGLAITVMSSAAVELALPGVNVVRTAVGDRHLQQAMGEHGLELGCEESGHVLFDDALAAGDGLVTGLRAIIAAVEQRQQLSDVAAAFRPFPRRVTKVPVQERRPLEQLEPLVSLKEKLETDLGQGGRVFLRYSGTEPVLRILVEGAEEIDVQQVSDRVTQRAAEVLS